jgi:pyridinium-3,5-bisthiocarboxylic acid mononucleotide nickel chelatase
MKILYLDCFSGISGDMMVGALTDLGVQPSTFEWELSKVALGDFHMHFERQSRQNIVGVKFGIHEGATHTHEQDEPHVHGPDCDHGHHHTHAEHVHGPDCDHSHEEEHHHHEEHSHGRTHRDIRSLISESTLSDFVKTRSLAIFQRIAVAEGKIHGQPPADVTFHEVGALDSIADILCTCIGLEALGVEKILVSRLFDGSGWIDCAHGSFPIPSTATLEILAGIPVSQIDEPFEFITPTGAAIVAELGSGFTAMPELIVEKIGYGVGTRQLASRPNVLRALLGTLATPSEDSAKKKVAPQTA